MTTSHLTNVTDQFQREFILVKIKRGREVEIELTKKGKILLDLLRKFEELSKMPESEIFKDQEVKNG